MTALIIIDVQMGFKDPIWGERNNHDAEQNIARLLERWRSEGKPIIHVRHDSTSPNSPLHPGNPGNAFQSEVQPRAGEKIIGKTVNSAFIGTDLEAHLREQGIREVVFAGLTTDHCVSTTTRMAGNLGFEVKLVADATATFAKTDREGQKFSAETVHAVHLASLDGEFCQVVTTAELIP